MELLHGLLGLLWRVAGLIAAMAQPSSTPADTHTSLPLPLSRPSTAGGPRSLSSPTSLTRGQELQPPPLPAGATHHPTLAPICVASKAGSSSSVATAAAGRASSAATRAAAAAASSSSSG